MKNDHIDELLGHENFNRVEEIRNKCADIDDLLSMEGMTAEAAEKLKKKKHELEAEAKGLVRNAIGRNTNDFFC